MKSEKLLNRSGHYVNGPLLLKPSVFRDDRGFFLESWNHQVFKNLLEEDGQSPDVFVQDNHSQSRFGVLRGLHYQLPPHPQAKLVRCVTGEIFDVAVDIRKDSPTFGSWVSARLSAENCHQLWIPPGFAHGFLTLSERADVLYKTTYFWNRDSERSIRWNDPRIMIDWPEIDNPLLSDKDAVASYLSDQEIIDWTA